jgi:hypothetical protein
MVLKVTLDTNCFFDYFEREPRHVQALIDLQAQGRIEIAMTTRVMADTLNRWKGRGTSPIWTKIQSFPILETLGSAFRLDMSRLDSEDYLTSDADAKIIDRLREIMIDAQVEDVDHLFGHIMAKSDIFVTSDSHFLNHDEELKNEFEAVVLKPEDAVERIEKLIV